MSIKKQISYIGQIHQTKLLEKMQFSIELMDNFNNDYMSKCNSINYEKAD